jgi:hypothetical protein
MTEAIAGGVRPKLLTRVMLASAIDLAERCAQGFLQVVNEHSTIDAAQAALLLYFMDRDPEQEPLTAMPVVVFDAVREEVRERLMSEPPQSWPTWPELWLPNEYWDAPGGLDDKYLLDEYREDRMSVGLEMDRAGSLDSGEEFWSEVARRMNAGPRPKYAVDDWCAVAISNGGNNRAQLQKSLPPTLFSRLEATGYIGAWPE